jgi:hypothetical protein
MLPTAIALSFVSAMIFSPWQTGGILTFLLYLLLFEAVYGILFRPSIEERFVIAIFSLFGWIYGRYLYGYSDIFFYECTDED